MKGRMLIFGFIFFFLMTACGSSKDVQDSRSSDQEGSSQQISQEDEKKKVGKESTEKEDNSQERTEEEESTMKEKDSAKMQEIARPSTAGQLHVSGSQLMDENDHPLQLKGISSHGIAWFPDYINEECFHEFSTEWKMNVIRLAMYTAEPSGYCSDGDKEEIKKLVHKGVEYASKEDMYVIIDWHILSDGDPNTNKDEAKVFFEEMTKAYGDYNNVIYEICNEPNGNVNWQMIKEYAQEVIPVIRQNDEDAIIIVGTPTWSQDVDLAALDPIDDYDNIMYALHFYAGTHKDNLRDKMNTAIESGLPIFVSEYGICDASGNGALDLEEAGKWVEAMDQAGLSYIMWNLSNKDESSAILKSTSQKTSGFTQDDLSQGGLWLKAMLLKDQDTLSQIKSQQASQNLVMEGESEGMEYAMEKVNSWDANDKHYIQYKLTVTNKTGDAINNWSFDIDLEDLEEVTDHWNCDLSQKEQTLTLSSLSYNGNLENEQAAEDIGMIVIQAAQ